jgi:DNA polymerase-4
MPDELGNLQVISATSHFSHCLLMSPDESSRSRRILLVDCDAFFVQVARLEDPEGVGKVDLLLVGGSPTGRGVVTSASYGARRFGVRSAMPTSQALRLCPDATVVGVPRGACGRRSREIKLCLEGLAPVVQAASIDEFYLDLSGTERLFGETLEATARRIRETVLEQTQVSVSIGGGTRRMIAKLASGPAKPGGVFVVPPGQEAEFMKRLDLADIPGIGPALVEALRKRGLVRVEDAVEVQQPWLERWFGARRGEWLYRRIRGLDSSRVDPREPRKSISSERTFFQDLESDEDLERMLLRLSTSVTRTLRKAGLRAKTITVKLRDADFKTRSRSRTVPDPIETTAATYGIVRELLAELRAQRRIPARLLGVGLTNLGSEDDPSQFGLFEEHDRLEGPRERALGHALDGLSERFGGSAVLPGRIIGD